METSEGIFLDFGADKNKHKVDFSKLDEISGAPFSHTRIKTFYKCRRKFILKYVFGFLEDTTIYEINRIIGVNMHLWIGEFYKNNIPIDSLENFFVEKIEENDFWIYEDMVQNFLDFEVLRRNNIYEVIPKKSTKIDYYIRPLICEEVLNDGVFAGYVDVLFLELDGSLTAVDWKTSDSLPKPGIKNFPPDEKRQLKIYARLSAKLPSMKRRDGYYGAELDEYMLSDNVLEFLGIERDEKLNISTVGDYYLRYGVFNFFHPKEKSYNELQNTLERCVITPIKSRNLKKNPNERECRMCGYLIKYCSGELDWYGL